MLGGRERHAGQPASPADGSGAPEIARVDPGRPRIHQGEPAMRRISRLCHDQQRADHAAWHVPVRNLPARGAARGHARGEVRRHVADEPEVDG